MPNPLNTATFRYLGTLPADTIDVTHYRAEARAAHAAGDWAHFDRVLRLVRLRLWHPAALRAMHGQE